MSRRPVTPEIRRLPITRGGGPRVAVVYPNTYYVGMANLGFQACLAQLSGQPITLDRVFIDHDAEELPRSYELDMPLSNFHALIFSVSFEPDYLGLVLALKRAGLAPLAEDRGPQDPLVVAGGIAVTLNPEPAAPFCDLMGVGEAEVLLPGLLPLLLEGPHRDDLVTRAARLPGWYAPTSAPPDPVARQHVPSLTEPCMPVILGQGAAANARVDLEVSRGCRWRCRFCAAGFVVTPYRELTPGELAPALEWAIEQRGRVGLVGTDVSDHSHLMAMAQAIWKGGGEVALPSLRVESLARKGSQAAELVRLRPPRTLTMAVEAATPSLRCALNKKVSQQQLLDAAQTAASAGVSQLRLYMLVGVPGETEQEVEHIATLASELQGAGPGGQLALSVNGLVPKAGTPMQWLPAPDLKYLRRCRRILRKRLGKAGIRLQFESPDWTRWQALLSLGDRATSRHLLRAAEQGWRRALAAAQGEEPLLSGERRPVAAELPWGFIGGRLGQDLLAREYSALEQRRHTPPARLWGRGQEVE